MAVGGIEEPGVFAGEYQRNAGAIRANGHGADRTAGADLANHLKAVGVPMPNGAVIGPGNKLCRRGGQGGQRSDRTGMALKFAGGFQLVGNIVHCDQVILLGRSELLAFGQEGDGIDLHRLGRFAFSRRCHFSGFAVGQRPGQQPAILGAGGDLGVVEGERHAGRGSLKPGQGLGCAALGKIVNLDSVALGHGQPFAIATHSLNALVRTEVQRLGRANGQAAPKFHLTIPATGQQIASRRKGE